MKNIIIALLSTFALATPGLSDPKVKGWKTYDSMGCMLLRECQDGVKEIKTLEDLQEYYPDIDFSIVSDEFIEMLSALQSIGVEVFLADDKYFPPLHRGVYHTVGNKFFLNKAYMDKPHQLMSVVRHEGWHVAQDSMAGSVSNNMIVVIFNEDKFLFYWRSIAEDTYPKEALPWEQEAMWAGHTEGMTRDALKICARRPMWEVYPPTPLTKKYLINEGYMK